MMFRKETEFQETEIGKLPKGWKIKRLGEIAKIVNGVNFPLKLQGKKNGKYPFIKVNDMNNSHKYIFNAENYVDDEDLPKLRARPFPKNTIIFPKIGMAIRLNKYRILGTDALFDNNTAGIITNENVAYYEFIYYYLQGNVDLITLANTTTVPSISKSRLEGLYIPLPPLEEQKSIADILSTVDSGIETVDRAVARLERMKRVLMNELLTGRIRVREENGKLTFYKETEFQETEIGEMPKDWKIEKLKNIVIKAKMGGTPRSTVREYWGGDIPFAKVEDITSSHKYLFKTSTTITKLGLENSNAWIIPKDSLLITIYGTLGAVAINKIELATNQAIVGIIPRKDIVDVEYLYYWYSFFQPNWNKYVKKSTQPNLTLAIVTNSKLPLPSIKEQKRIADVLSTIDSSIELYYKEKEELLRLRRGLMGVLLTGRVRVVSDVRDVGVVV